MRTTNLSRRFPLHPDTFLLHRSNERFLKGASGAPVAVIYISPEVYQLL